MQITASTFADPTLRPQLEKYYESKKAALLESWKSRDDAALPSEVKYKDSDGNYQTAHVIQMTPEKLQASLASFDDWLSVQQRIADTSTVELAHAQTMLESSQKLSPDDPSGVRTVFSSKGALQAYVNADGTAVSTNAAGKYVSRIIEAANKLGLTGQDRIDYLNTEIKSALDLHYGKTDVTTYTASNSPTRRNFANAWYKNYDIDKNYNDIKESAQQHYDSMSAWNQQWQSNLNEISSYLLRLQEAA